MAGPFGAILEGRSTQHKTAVPVTSWTILLCQGCQPNPQIMPNPQITCNSLPMRPVGVLLWQVHLGQSWRSGLRSTKQLFCQDPVLERRGPWIANSKGALDGGAKGATNRSNKGFRNTLFHCDCLLPFPVAWQLRFHRQFANRLHRQQLNISNSTSLGSQHAPNGGSESFRCDTLSVCCLRHGWALFCATCNKCISP